ncbi:MAG: M15 family peptidase [Dehalococcoidia bacterium]|jgi:peptidoglycan L-alanyl-D-glutamate endopeptidase CwlK
MPRFSAISRERLESCDPRIQSVLNEVIKHFDCTIIEGHRGQADQDRAYSRGKSKLKWPNGEHNKQPSRAVDAMPYPIDWKDINRLCYFAGYVMATALAMGIKLRWGKDWDGDTDLNDQTFLDGPHFELVD